MRWLRPDRAGEAPVDEPDDDAPPAEAAAAPAAWPDEVGEQLRAVLFALIEADAPVTAAALARRFAGAPRAAVRAHLDTLAALHMVRALPDDRFRG